ncbi:hypothetical protein ACE6H2_023260 [Prunus campanulata]
MHAFIFFIIQLFVLPSPWLPHPRDFSFNVNYVSHNSWWRNYTYTRILEQRTRTPTPIDFLPLATTNARKLQQRGGNETQQTKGNLR